MSGVALFCGRDGLLLPCPVVMVDSCCLVLWSLWTLVALSCGHDGLLLPCLVVMMDSCCLVLWS